MRWSSAPVQRSAACFATSSFAAIGGGAAIAHQHSIEIFQIDPIVVLSNADERRLRVPERGDRAGICGQLDENDVAWIDEHARSEVERLLGSRGDDHVVGSRADTAIRE